MNSRGKAQSAMEYLMSYGWAILIIAAVLGVLFQLGLFSGSSLTPKAQPGSCTVQRLLGQTSLTGQCQGQLPEFVGQFGSGSYIQTPLLTYITGSTSATMSTWVYMSNLNTIMVIFSDQWNAPNVLQLYVHTNGAVEADFGSGGSWIDAVTSPPGSITSGAWYHISATYTSGSGAQIYINGIPQTLYYVVGSPSATGTLGGSAPYGDIGCTVACGNIYVGEISNMQIYNSSLSQTEATALYRGGIGGTPVRLQNLVVWWPLDGDVKDYSGNNYNGQISGQVTFNSTWNS